MLNRKVNYYFLIVLALALMTSCVKDVDFDQADDLSLSPVIAASILYTEAEAFRFSENSIEIETITDSIANIEIFEDQFINDNLVKVDLVFEADNSINRAFNIQVDFLNTADELQHTISFDVLESPFGSPIVTEYTEVFEDESLYNLKSITKMTLRLTLYNSSDGSILNEDSLGKVALKSKGLFYFDIVL